MRVSSLWAMAAAVRGRRTDLKLSQAELARRAGVSRKWISEFEAGKPIAEFGLVFDLTGGADAAASRPAKRVDLDALLDEQRG